MNHEGRSIAAAPPHGLRIVDLIRAARPTQWSKSVFVIVGPFYGLTDPALRENWGRVLISAFVAAAIFGLVSSALYMLNDVIDAEQDRAHPRKRNRPIASGAVSPRQAAAFAVVLMAMAVAAIFLLEPGQRILVGFWTIIYAGNVVAYTFLLKHKVIADVVCLSLGFVLRVIAGCAAVGISPTTWLLNCTFFLAMFLAFGKRLGERRTMENDPASVRSVQAKYTDELLRMAVVVTAVASLVTYASYVQAHEPMYSEHPGTWSPGFNLLWLTVLPATYALLRCIVLLEKGRFDDPTEIATHDRGFQAAVGVFGVLTLAMMLLFRAG